MNIEFLNALDEFEKQKGISKESLIETLELAMAAAYKRNYGETSNVRVEISMDDGSINISELYDVVEEVVDERTQISLEDAHKTDVALQLGDVCQRLVPSVKFGRIAAQTAKQVIQQRVREAERGIIYDELTTQQDELMMGRVRRIERGVVYIGIEKTEAIMPTQEQMNNERYYPNDYIKVYLAEVRRTSRGPQVIVSRAHPGLVRRLFEEEVPEIQSGVVEIKSIAREAGNRTKISVYSHNPEVDPVGACVGRRGMRVEHIVEELHGEKIDIVPWNEDVVEYIASALSPAKVSMVQLNENDKIARIVVADNQLSLAIGREGQNARLAARLTGWKIDIKSQSQILQIMQDSGESEELDQEYDLIFDEDIEPTGDILVDTQEE